MSLTAKLGDQVQLELPEDPSDPLPSYDPPADSPLITTSEIARLVRDASGVVHVAGCFGGAAGLVARALALGLDRDRPIVCVAPDPDQARQLATDLSFLWGEQEDEEETAQGQVLHFAANEASPYADVNPDRRAAMSRLATLFHLEHGLPFRFLVTSAAALARKVVPRSAVAEHSGFIAVDQDIDRETFLASLGASGYIRVPLVEDPGTFAVRGSIIDVWPPGSDSPVRVELLGDAVLSIKLFDPEAQRTLREIRDLWVPPAREAILTPERAERARERIRALCDAVDLPTSRARALSEDVASGRTFYGAEGMLPACYDLAPLWSYLPDRCVVLLEDPASITRAIRDELGRAMGDEANKSREPHFPLSDFFVEEDSLEAWLRERTILALHRVAVSGGDEASGLELLEAAPANTPHDGRARSLGSRTRHPGRPRTQRKGRCARAARPAHRGVARLGLARGDRCASRNPGRARLRACCAIATCPAACVPASSTRAGSRGATPIQCSWSSAASHAA